MAMIYLDITLELMNLCWMTVVVVMIATGYMAYIDKYKYRRNEQGRKRTVFSCLD